MMMTMLAVLISAMTHTTPQLTPITMTYTSAARGVIRHAYTAADHPERFTSSERTVVITSKGKL